MVQEFYALPVRSGESFALTTQRHDGSSFHVLVDGGYRGSKNQEPPVVHALKTHLPHITCFDVVICTHNDRDHSGGLARLADTWPGQIKEFWLPGAWALVASRLLQDFSGLAEEVLEAARQVATELDAPEMMVGVNPEKLYAQAMEKLETIYQDETSEARYVVSPEELSSSEVEFLEADDRIANSLRISKSELSELIVNLEKEEESHSAALEAENKFPAGVSGLVSMLNMRALDTARVVREITSSAVRHNIPIRWFDFGAFMRTGQTSGGERGLLEPVNARELVRPQPVSALASLAALTLTRENVESLVFYHPETPQRPGVLFLADSRLAFGVSRPKSPFPMTFETPQRPIIATAPHHGSHRNDFAYGVLSGPGGWAPAGVSFLRNGGRSNQRLSSFLAQQNRSCAFCPQHSVGARLVRVNDTGNNWQWSSSRVFRCP